MTRERTHGATIPLRAGQRQNTIASSPRYHGAVQRPTPITKLLVCGLCLVGLGACEGLLSGRGRMGGEYDEPSAVRGVPRDAEPIAMEAEPYPLSS